MKLKSLIAAHHLAPHARLAGYGLAALHAAMGEIVPDTDNAAPFSVICILF